MHLWYHSIVCFPWIALLRAAETEAYEPAPAIEHGIEAQSIITSLIDPAQPRNETWNASPEFYDGSIHVDWLWTLLSYPDAAINTLMPIVPHRFRREVAYTARLLWALFEIFVLPIHISNIGTWVAQSLQVSMRVVLLHIIPISLILLSAHDPQNHGLAGQFWSATLYGYVVCYMVLLVVHLVVGRCIPAATDAEQAETNRRRMPYAALLEWKVVVMYTLLPLWALMSGLQNCASEAVSRRWGRLVAIVRLAEWILSLAAVLQWVFLPEEPASPATLMATFVFLPSALYLFCLLVLLFCFAV